MSGGKPPTKTFLEYRSSESSDFGEEFRDDPKDGTVWSELKQLALLIQHFVSIRMDSVLVNYLILRTSACLILRIYVF